MQVARKSSDNRKAEIVTATLRLADELGPDRLTTLAVAKVVGLTQPGIFRHFPTKQDLWMAVAARIAATMSAAWAGVLAAGLAPPDRLAALIMGQLRQIAANPAIPAILHSRELHSENAALRAEFIGLMARFQDLLVAALTEGRDQGENNDPEKIHALSFRCEDSGDCRYCNPEMFKDALQEK